MTKTNWLMGYVFITIFLFLVSLSVLVMSLLPNLMQYYLFYAVCSILLGMVSFHFLRQSEAIHHSDRITLIHNTGLLSLMILYTYFFKKLEIINLQIPDKMLLFFPVIPNALLQFLLCFLLFNIPFILNSLKEKHNLVYYLIPFLIFCIVNPLILFFLK
jgi:hypothetical protein